MNNFNKQELQEIHNALKYVIKSGVIPYSIITIALKKKVHSMLDNYCEHKETEMDCDGGISLVCCKCGETVMDI